MLFRFYVQPGPRDGTMQCFIRRDKSTQTYYLYLSLGSGMLLVTSHMLYVVYAYVPEPIFASA